MTDNSRAKAHLNQAETRLNNLDNISDINTLIAARSLDLFNNLSSENLFLDDDIKANLQTVNNKLVLWWLDVEASNEIRQLDLEFAWATPARRTEIWRQINSLLKITDWTRAAPLTWSPNLIARRFEYNQMNTFANYFNLWNRITDIDLNINSPVWWARWSVGGVINQNLDGIFKTVPWNPNAEYKLCDEQGNPLPESWWNYTIQIWWQTATLSGISLAARTLDLRNLTITPPNVDLSQPLNLSINATYTNATMMPLWGAPAWANLRNINLVCNKKFKLNLTDWTPLNNRADREVAFDSYNNSWYGQRIENQFNTTLDKERYKIERESLERALKHCDWPKYELLNTPEMKEQFYQYIRKSAHPWLPWLFFDALYTALPINTYAWFRDWFTDDDRDWNKDRKNTSSDRRYRDFIHNNLEQKTKEWFWAWLDQLLIDSAAANNYLKWELTAFLDNIEKQKLDNNMHDDVTSDISDRKWWRHRLNKKRRHSILWLFRLGRQDETPMKFFNGSKTSVRSQKVNITTNSGPEDLNNKEPVEYWLDLEISWKNKIEATIALEWEPPFTLKSWDPAALIRNVLRHQPIKYWKVRAHIAYNIIKWIINMSKDIDMPLIYSNMPWINREIKLDWDSIVLEEQDDTWSKRNTTKLFDYKLFETTNTFDSGIAGDNRSLRNGIDVLMSHMTFALNERHDQFCKATEWRNNTTTNFPTSYLTSPLKKLLNCRTTTNFDFQTTVQWKNWKSVQIEFTKNKFIINSNWLKKPISWKSLWKLLNHIQWWARFFDWVERDICAAVYWEMIKKLRENSKIAKTNFAVRDDLTWRTYVLDDEWRFWYLSHRDATSNSGRIKKKNWMNYATKWITTWWLITWWFLTGWIWAVLNPLSWKWLATIPLFAWWALSAANLWVYWTRNRRKKEWFDYWVIDQDPPGLVMCKESETKELLKNPLLMWRMIKAMNDRLGNIHFK